MSCGSISKSMLSHIEEVDFAHYYELIVLDKLVMLLEASAYILHPSEK